MVLKTFVAGFNDRALTENYIVTSAEEYATLICGGRDGMRYFQNNIFDYFNLYLSRKCHCG
jgi:hypothetical protein